MDTTPITGLDELEAHLDELLQDPRLPCNVKLFDEVELQLTDANIPPLSFRFLPKLITILKSHTLDVRPIASLSTRLLDPIPFTRIFALADELSLIQALDYAAAPSTNLLVMTVLHKAADSAEDAVRLAGMADLVAAFVRRWLASPDVGVGEKGTLVLGDILRTDCDVSTTQDPSPRMTNGIHSATTSSRGHRISDEEWRRRRTSPGKGAMWKLILGDPHMFNLLKALVSGEDAETAVSANQLSLAQGRLLRLLPRLAYFNFAAISRPAAASISNSSGADEQVATGQTLLQFAALRMVDMTDILMRLMLQDFFQQLVLATSQLEDWPSYMVDTMKMLLRVACLRDGELKENLTGMLQTLEDSEELKEAERLQEWLFKVLPGEREEIAELMVRERVGTS